MPKIKLDGQVLSNTGDALALHARSLYDVLGTSRMVIGELRSVERTQPASDEAKEPVVKLRLVGVEVADAQQEDAVREAQRALYLLRTAAGTLDDEGTVELADETMKYTGGLLTHIAAAQQRVALSYWAQQAAAAMSLDTATPTELRHELQRIHEGLQAALEGTDTDAH